MVNTQPPTQKNFKDNIVTSQSSLSDKTMQKQHDIAAYSTNLERTKSMAYDIIFRSNAIDFLLTLDNQYLKKVVYKETDDTNICEKYERQYKKILDGEEKNDLDFKFKNYEFEPVNGKSIKRGNLVFVVHKLKNCSKCQYYLVLEENKKQKIFFKGCKVKK